jgi:hypothetical protein
MPTLYKTRKKFHMSKYMKVWRSLELETVTWFNIHFF